MTTPVLPGQRVAVVSLTYKATPRVIEYVRMLVGNGARVDLFVTAIEEWHELADLPDVHLHGLDGAEDRQFALRLERGLLFSLPRLGLRLADRIAATRPGRALRRPVSAAAETHDRLASGVHRRIFMPVYRVFRPRAMAKLFLRRLKRIDLTDVHRIVATDVHSITLGWHLAQRCPTARATTVLEP